MTQLTPANAERLRSAFLQCCDMDGSLREQLEAYAAAGREIFPAYGEAVDRLVERLHANGGGENAPRPGDPMGSFNRSRSWLTTPLCPIMGTVLKMEYVVEDDGKRLRPTELGMLVTDLLVVSFPDVLNVEFTAGMSFLV